MSTTSPLRSIVEQLAAFKHRAIVSREHAAIFNTLAHWVKDEDVEVIKQDFRAPRHYLQILYWLLGGFVFCLASLNILSWWACLLALALTVMGVQYFDWRHTFLSKLPPRTDCFNFIARKQVGNPQFKLILMAHWDTAPISILYLPRLLKGFRSSLFMGVVMFVFALVICIFSLFYNNGILYGLRVIGIAYFLVQILIISIDYWRLGYANGANDNATGCAIALSLANELWKKMEGNYTVEVCITGAEEAGMLGAQHYYSTLKSEKGAPMYILNFDTVGCEQLQVITASGTFTTINYDNDLLQIAKQVAPTLGSPIRFASYHTADVDTVWFARTGVPCLSMISHNAEGLPAYIHRPEDTIDKIHWSTLDLTLNFAQQICEQLIEQKITHGSE